MPTPNLFVCWNFVAERCSAPCLELCGRTLLSTGYDGTIGVWVLGTWSHLRTMRVSEHVTDARFCNCLAVSGSMLLCGGMCMDESGFVLVLDADTFACQHTLRLDHTVEELLSVRGEVGQTRVQKDMGGHGEAGGGIGGGVGKGDAGGGVGHERGRQGMRRAGAAGEAWGRQRRLEECTMPPLLPLLP